jgi:hypothetical protein
MIIAEKIFQLIGSILGHIFKLIKDVINSILNIFLENKNEKPKNQIISDSKRNEFEPYRNKDESFIKGETFENYVREVLFPKENYKLLERTHSYESNKKDFVASSCKPDFTFLQKDNNFEFYVEAKYRSTVFFEKVKWCEHYQFKRYNQYAEEKPVFIVIGYGGTPNNPDIVYIENIENIKYTELYLSVLKKGQFSKQKEVFEFN